MSLDIGVGDGSSFIPAQGEPSLSLDDDGYYWFLHPLFERLRTDTGQYIDLYGDAHFDGECRAALERVLAEARRLAGSQPEEWQVHVGTQLMPEHKELFQRVERETMLKLLDRWDNIVQRAKRLSRPVVCLGD
jgi:hypothetical protein